MHGFRFIALLLSLGDTPEQTFADVKKALAGKNFGAVFDDLAPSDRKELEDEWKKQKESFALPENAEDLKGLAEILGMKEDALRKLSAREFHSRHMTRMSETEPERFKRECGKFMTGTVTQKKVDGDTCVFQVQVEERREEVEFVRDGGRWYLSMAPERRAANHRFAGASLMAINAAEADFRSNDRDADGIKNYWVKDVAGLYGIEAGNVPIKLIEVQTAAADRTAGKGTYAAVKEGMPYNGYVYASLKSHREKGKSVDYDEGKGRNASRFGMTSYPAQYGLSGKWTYITSEVHGVWSKDTGGKPPEEFPEDPAKEGWEKIR